MHRIIRVTISVLLYFVIFAALFVSKSYAETTYGIKGGISVMKIRGDYSSGDPIIAPCGGAYISIKYMNGFIFQPEFLLIIKGIKSDYAPYYDTVEKDTFLYFEVPALAKYRASASDNVGISIFAGPSIGMLINEGYKFTGTDADYVAYLYGVSTSGSFNDLGIDTNFFDFGLTFGFGIDYKLSEGTLNLDVRYSLGLTNIFNTDPAVNAKNGGFMIMAGYTF